MVLKITNLHILRYLPTCWLYLLERYTIDNQRCTHTASEGDCFRYLTDNNNVQYFTGTIDSFDTCQNFILYNNLHSPGALVEIPPLDDNKSIRNELIFHSNEVRALGIITTHYDATIFELFSQIHSNKVSANDILFYF